MPPRSLRSGFPASSLVACGGSSVSPVKKALPSRIACRDLGELLEIACADRCVRVPLFEIGLSQRRTRSISDGQSAVLVQSCCMSEASAANLSRPSLRLKRRQKLKRGAACRTGPRAVRRCRGRCPEELQNPEARHAVESVLRPAQHREQVLDMGGLEEFQAAEFHEGDVAPASSISSTPL